MHLADIKGEEWGTYDQNSFYEILKELINISIKII